MAKPKVFVSSTYYDLKHIRANLESFIQSLGYESILFESGDIPFHHENPLDISCYNAVETVHIFVLIIGGRYGSFASDQLIDKDSEKTVIEKKYDQYNSITRKEYETARKKGIPIYTFIEKGVAAEYLTYKKNKKLENLEYAHVDNVSVFKLIETIYSQPTNNQVKEFENFENISSWLKSQWAGLFAEYLEKRETDEALANMSQQLSSLKQVAEALELYSKGIFRKVDPDEANKVIDEAENDQTIRETVFKFPMIAALNKNYFLNSGKSLELNTIIQNVADYESAEKFIRAMHLENEASKLGSSSKSLNIEYFMLRKKLADVPKLRPYFLVAPPVLDPSSKEQVNAFFEKQLLSYAPKPHIT